MTPHQHAQGYATADTPKQPRQPRWRVTIELPADQPRIPAILLASIARCLTRADASLGTNTTRELLTVMNAIAAELQLRRP